MSKLGVEIAERLGLLTPVWPVNLVWGLYMLLKLRWEKADIDLERIKK